jgi:hypothetical protein
MRKINVCRWECLCGKADFNYNCSADRYDFAMLADFWRRLNRWSLQIEINKQLL